MLHGGNLIVSSPGGGVVGVGEDERYGAPAVSPPGVMFRVQRLNVGLDIRIQLNPRPRVPVAVTASVVVTIGHEFLIETRLS